MQEDSRSFSLFCLFRATGYFTTIHSEAIHIITITCAFWLHSQLFLDGVTLDTKRTNAPDTTSHDKLLLGAEIDLEVLNEGSLFCLDHLARHGLYVLFLIFSFVFSFGIRICSLLVAP